MCKWRQEKKISPSINFFYHKSKEGNWKERENEEFSNIHGPSALLFSLNTAYTSEF